MHRQARGTGAKREAFTLIELLTVIAIIGILAGLLVPLSGIVTTKSRIARVTAELNRYITGIETYKLEVGSYPPDNGLLRKTSTNTVAGYLEFRRRLQLNPLYYELAGAVFTNVTGVGPVFRTVSTRDEISPNTLEEVFEVRGIQNSARTAFDIPYKGMTFKESQSMDLWRTDGAEVELLSVPVPGPASGMLEGTAHGSTGKTKFNAWYYDSSSTNRNNRATFDLWAEIIVGNKTNIIGNWKN